MKLPVTAPPEIREMLAVLLEERLDREALHMEGSAGWRTLINVFALAP